MCVCMHACMYIFGHVRSQLHQVGSLVAACELLVVTRGVCFPDQGSTSGSQHWECRVLATGPPGKSPIYMIS